MSLAYTERLELYLNNAPEDDYIVSVLEVTHSNFSKPWYLWSEPESGRVALDDGTVVDVLCINFKTEQPPTDGRLDQIFSIAVDTTDVDDKFREEVDAIPLDSLERVQLVYREYLRSDLTEPGASVPLEAESCSFAIGAATISAVAPRLNVAGTGEVYAPYEIPMLRAFN